MRSLLATAAAIVLMLPGFAIAQQSKAPTAADADRMSAQMAELFPEASAAEKQKLEVQTGYAPLVKAWLNSYLRDPYSAVVTEVRGPRVTSFKPDVWTKVTGTAVCYDINAKNAYGGYTGVKRHLFIFEAGRVAYHISTGDERENSLAPMLVRSECDRPAGS